MRVVFIQVEKNERNNEMKKALIVTHVSGFVPQFELNNVRILQELGYEVHYASNFHNISYGTDNHRLEGTGIVCHQVDFARSPFDFKTNSRAYRQLKQVMKEQHFKLVHCHTPVGAVYARLAARKHRKKGTRVIYTAHGFHFYKGAPLKFWLVSYPMEWLLAHMTDVLITINEEDLQNAKKLPLAKRNGVAGRVYKIDSVGIDLKKYQKDELYISSRMKLRQEFGIPENAFVVVSVGELNWNKNHAVVVEALGKLKELKLHYIICGEGIEKVPLAERAEHLGIEARVHLLGFREDIPDILKASDAMVFPSLREGLGLVAVEAMASGLPVIASDNRGTREYMQDGVNGYVVWKNDVDGTAESIKKLYHMWTKDKASYHQMQQNCLKTAERFSSENVSRTMRQIYEEQ